MHRPVWLEHPVWECLQVARPSHILCLSLGTLTIPCCRERPSVHHAQALLVQHNRQQRHHFLQGFVVNDNQISKPPLYWASQARLRGLNQNRNISEKNSSPISLISIAHNDVHWCLVVGTMSSLTLLSVPKELPISD
ncbi:hypothetical protein TNCV_3783331 [Trichonephila clavipes]|nr:hypothetical protein TNCV_3783331 [Trichonephila clavipes]